MKFPHIIWKNIENPGLYLTSYGVKFEDLHFIKWIIHTQSNTFHYLVAKDSMKDNRNIKNIFTVTFEVELAS